MDIVQAVVELLRKAATDLPADVEAALTAAFERETGSLPRSVLSVTLENIRAARAESRPMCQDTGVPIFFVTAARGTSYEGMVLVLGEAVRVATREVPLRANAVDIWTGRNTGDGVGEGVPVVYFTEWQQDYHIIDLLLKGGGSENIGASYKLPDAALGAQRDVDGIRKAVLDAAWRAQGKGCPPYIIGVGIAGLKDDAAVLARRQLLRKITDRAEDDTAVALERRLTDEINSLEIGPAGLSGGTTALAVKVAAHARHPATFFVDVAFGCWAHRRRRLRFREGHAVYE
jgi:fumarate hydratase class I